MFIHYLLFEIEQPAGPTKTIIGATVPCHERVKMMHLRALAGGGLGRNAARTTLLLLIARLKGLWLSL